MPAKMKVFATDFQTFSEALPLSQELFNYPKKTVQADIDVINKDLGRSCFINTNGKAYADLDVTWNTQSANNNYMQGNIDGLIFRLINVLFFTTSKEKNTIPRVFLDQEGKQIFSLEDGAPNFCLTNTKSFNFAYYDVDPNDSSKTIPCALYISYSPIHPHFWSMGLIRNTVGAHQDREVNFICNPEVVGCNATDKDLANTENAVVSLLAKINTPKIVNLLQDILNPDGTLNIAKLEVLNSLTHPNMSAKVQENIDEFVQKDQEISPYGKHISERIILKKQQDLENKQRRNLNLMLAGVIIASIVFALSLFFTGGLTALVPAVATLASLFGPAIYFAAVTYTALLAGTAISLLGAIGYGISKLINYCRKAKPNTEPNSPPPEEMQTSCASFSKLNNEKAEAPPPAPQNAVDLLQPHAPEDDIVSPKNYTQKIT